MIKILQFGIKRYFLVNVSQYSNLSICNQCQKNYVVKFSKHILVDIKIQMSLVSHKKKKT